MSGVITTGRTLDEAKDMIRDALVEYLASFDPCKMTILPVGAIEEIVLAIAT